MRSVWRSILVMVVAATFCGSGCDRSEAVIPPRPKPPRPDASVEFNLFETISVPEPARTHIIEVLSREPTWFDTEEEGLSKGAHVGTFIVDGEEYLFIFGELNWEVNHFKGFYWEDERLREMDATFRRLNSERSNAVAREMLKALESTPTTSATQQIR